MVIEVVHRKVIKNWWIRSKGTFAMFCATFARTLRDMPARSITRIPYTEPSSESFSEGFYESISDILNLERKVQR